MFLVFTLYRVIAISVCCNIGILQYRVIAISGNCISGYCMSGYCNIGLLHIGLLHMGFLHIGFLLKGPERGKISGF
jgi:hypothetical protein